MNTTLSIDTNALMYNEYINLLINRVVYASMIIGTSVKDPHNYENALILEDDLKAASTLLYSKRALTEEYIKKIAYLVNYSNKEITFGYRKNKCLYEESDIPAIPASSIEKKMRSLIRNYKTKWKTLDPYLREAMFHIDFIRIHPFHDGNARTAQIFLAYNLLRQKLYPVVIDSDVTLEYQRCINTLDYQELANLFYNQAQKEQTIFNNLTN